MKNQDRVVEIAKYAAGILFVIFLIAWAFDLKAVVSAVHTISYVGVIGVGFLAPALLWSKLMKQGVQVMLPWAGILVLLIMTVVLTEAVL